MYIVCDSRELLSILLGDNSIEGACRSHHGDADKLEGIVYGVEKKELSHS